MPDCECGCGSKTKGGRFLPGHDAKLKKALIEAALSGSKRAATKLGKLGWAKFLAAKQGALANKPERRREERRREGKHAENSGAAKAARTLVPTLNPPLDEQTARILGFGEKAGNQE